MPGRFYSISRKILKWLAIIVFGILVLLIIIIFVIRTSWAQKVITDKVTAFVSGKTNTKVEIQSLFITFSGDVHLEGVYLEDLKQDTLVYIGKLETGVAFLPLLNGNINIKDVEWDGLVANVSRDKDSIFNFNFLIDAFKGEPKPETTEAKGDSALPNISIGDLDFTRFRLSYRDEIMGMDAKLSLDTLKLSTKSININTLEVKLDELSLSGVSGDVKRWLALPDKEEEDTTASKLPFIAFNNIALSRISLRYVSLADSMDAAVDLGSLQISKSEIDLNKQDVSVDALLLKNTVMLLHLAGGSKEDKPEDKKTPTAFIWPVWKLSLNKLELADNTVELKMGTPSRTPGQFNPMDIALTGLQLKMEDVKLDNNNAELKMINLAFKEQSGMEINQLAFEVKVDDKQAEVKKLNLTTPNNYLRTDVSLKYESPDSLIKNFLASTFDVDIQEADLSVVDAFYFAPELKKDTLIQAIMAYPLTLTGHVSGKLNDVEINELEVSGLSSLHLSINGHIKGLPDTSRIEVDIPALALSISRKDLLIFVKDSATQASLPDSIRLQAMLKGSAKDLKTNLNLKTDRGDVKLVADLKNIFGTPAAKGNLELTAINVEKIASIPDLEPVSLTLEFDEKGKDLNNLFLDASIKFQELTYRKYDYSNLVLKVNAADQHATVDMQHKDENLDFTLLLTALLDTVDPAAHLKIDLKGVDLNALGFSSEKVKFGATLEADYKDTLDAFKSWVKVENGVIIQQSDVYRMRPINVVLNNSADSTELDIRSEIVNGHLEANTSVNNIVKSLTDYLGKLASADSLRQGLMNDSLDVSAHFTVNNSMLLKTVVLPDLVQMDTIRIDLEFHPVKNELSLIASAPKIIYAGYTLDSLGVHAAAYGDHMDGALAFRHIDGGPIDIHRTRVDFGFKNKKAEVALMMNDSAEDKLAAFKIGMDLSTQNTLIHISADTFLLSGERWTVPEGNQISITNKGTIYTLAEISNKAQQFSVENITKGDPDGVKFSFKNFELSSITTMLHTKDSLLSGTLNGDLQLTGIKTNPGIKADINLSKLTLLGNELGLLKLNTASQGGGKYNVDLSLKGDAIDLETKGSLNSSGEFSADLKADLNRVDVKLLEGFVPKRIKNSSGSVNGHFTLSGPLSTIKYKGNVAFNKASFNLSAVNTQFTLPADKIEVSNEGLVFKDFDLTDANGKKTTINGNVDTKNMLNPAFDLHVVATNFQLLNSTRDDNDLFYGKAFIDTDIKLGGTLNLPKINARAKLRKGSDITFIVPESQAEIEERKGLVRFKNMKDTVNTILVVDEDESLAPAAAIDLTAYLEIDRETKFQLVIDERSGDKIQIAGEAKLNVNMTPNGILSLTGSYEVNSGSYDMNFYGLAKRKLVLVPGSRIVWSGDPLHGDLNLTAKYNIKTSVSDLMADQLSSTDPTANLKFRQELPFIVSLNINGELLKPKISFGIDMPEGSRQALDGSVYRRIRQLNEVQSELDKQVFSLIVLNRFLPQGSNEGGGTQPENLARSSASKLLSGQLNAYSAKYLKGFELNFDLDSYSASQSVTGQNKTDLGVNIRKGLFNDRVVVQVGSQVALEGQTKSYEASDILGDLSLEYLLTKQGQYRLKAFRKTQFQDLVEGQIMVTGLSVMFSKDFDDLKDLVTKPPKEKEEPEETEEAEEEEVPADEIKEEEKPTEEIKSKDKP